MTPTKDQIKEYYSQALQRCLDAYAKLDDKEWGKKASDRWTAKDYLAHLVIGQEDGGQPHHHAGAGRRAAGHPRLSRSARTSTTTTQRDAGRRVRDLPASELLDRLKAAVEEHLAMLDGLTEADLDKPARSPAWDRPGTVRDLFFGSYLFLPGQYQDIRRVAKKKLPHWMEASTPDQVNYQLDRIFHYMPLIFRSDKRRRHEGDVPVHMEGEGGGQWAMPIADGKAESAGRRARELRHRDQDEAGALDRPLEQRPQRRCGRSPTRKVHLGGNAGLAMKLGTLFSAEE